MVMLRHTDFATLMTSSLVQTVSITHSGASAYIAKELDYFNYFLVSTLTKRKNLTNLSPTFF